MGRSSRVGWLGGELLRNESILADVGIGRLLHFLVAGNVFGRKHLRRFAPGLAVGFENRKPGPKPCRNSLIAMFGRLPHQQENPLSQNGLINSIDSRWSKVYFIGLPGVGPSGQEIAA